jgi:hypothetical protein
MMTAYARVTDKNQLHWMDYGEHPMLYVARLSHANYTRPKVYGRIFWLFNDDCSQNHIAWTQADIRMWSPYSAVMQYKGRWAQGYTNYFVPQLSGANPSASATCWDRLFAFTKW